MDKDQEQLNADLFRALGRSAPAVKAALEAGADPNAKDNEESSPLFRLINLAQDGRALTDKRAVGMIKALLEAGACPHEPGNTSSMEPYDSAPPLHCVIQLGWAECAKALLSAGADPFAEDTTGMTPFDCLAQSAGEDAQRMRATLAMARALVEHGGDIDAEGAMRVPPLMLALLDLNEPLIETLLEAGADPKWRCGESGRGALHALAGGQIAGNEMGSFGKLPVAARLADRFMGLGLSPEDEDFDGETPLGLSEGEMRAVFTARAEREALSQEVGSAPTAGRRPRV